MIHLLQVLDYYQKRTNLSDSTIGTYALKSGKSIGLLRNKGTVSLATMARLAYWLFVMYDKRGFEYPSNSGTFHMKDFYIEWKEIIHMYNIDTSKFTAYPNFSNKPTHIPNIPYIYQR